MSTNDYYPIPVHYRHIDAVMAFIVGLQDSKAVESEGPAPTQEAEPVEEAAEVEELDWDDALLADLATDRGVTPKRVQSLLDILSAHPGHEFSVDDLAEALELTPEQTKGTLSGLTRHLNKHYQGRTWPFAYRWEESSEMPGMRYYVWEGRAAQWRAVRGDSAE